MGKSRTRPVTNAAVEALDREVDVPVASDGTSHRSVTVAAAAPTSCATMKPGASAGRMAVAFKRPLGGRERTRESLRGWERAYRRPRAVAGGVRHPKAQSNHQSGSGAFQSFSFLMSLPICSASRRVTPLLWTSSLRNG